MVEQVDGGCSTGCVGELRLPFPARERYAAATLPGNLLFDTIELHTLSGPDAAGLRLEGDIIFMLRKKGAAVCGLPSRWRTKNIPNTNALQTCLLLEKADVEPEPRPAIECRWQHVIPGKMHAFLECNNFEYGDRTGQGLIADFVRSESRGSTRCDDTTDE